LPPRIRNVGRRYQQGGLDRALHEKQRPGAAEVLDDSQEQSLIAVVCSSPPEGRARWTVSDSKVDTPYRGLTARPIGIPGSAKAADCHHALVRINRQLFAIAVGDVREMVIMPEVAVLPDAPCHIRGVVNLRGSVLPVVDTRTRMGFRSSLAEIDDFCAMLRQREQDHVNWINELEASVREAREFRLTLDPHQCAFGKWYDVYKSNDALIDGLLRKFDAPHKRIHEIGREVRAPVHAGGTEAARQVIDGCRGSSLQEMRGSSRACRRSSGSNSAKSLW
jgi:hypothetical protein